MWELIEITRQMPESIRKLYQNFDKFTTVNFVLEKVYLRY